ncbi:MAG: hypothetical protein IK091_07515, partial [Spirochaetales bacterium]|nr:hypothetical protein [Spirochaetales bacterium]
MKLKRLLALGLAAVMSLSILAGCSGSSSTPEPRDEKITATVTVWGPQEDQSEENGKWLQTQCEAFAAAHPDWTLTFNYGVCSEGDAKTNVGTDPSAAADVYMFANDQIPDLLKAEALAELGGKTAEDIKANNSATTVNTVTYNGGIYGVPFTANTWFMYYDKSAFTEEDILSMEAMLQKGKVAFPLSNSWYMAAMYVANGCTLFGEDGGDADAGIDFGGDKAVAVTNYLVDLVANPNFVNGDVSSTTDVKAFFSGTWDYQKAVEAYGDNLGIAPAPYISIDGEVKQMKAFAGSKAIGVNPQSALYAEHPEVAVALAAWLGSTDAQNSHYA